MSNKGHSKEYRNKLIKEVLADGWYLVRQKGSHCQFKHPTKSGKVTIPWHITKNIELSIRRQAGIKESKKKQNAYT